MSGQELIVSLAFFSSVTYMCGWLADRIMSSTGFGHIGNWLFLLGGAYSGMYAYNTYGYKLQTYPVWSLVVIVGAATLLLFFMSIVKRIFYV